MEKQTKLEVMIMLRKTRVKRKMGMYHIILRENNRQNVFNKNKNEEIINFIKFYREINEDR